MNEIQKYISDQLKNGFSENEIMDILIKNGYNDAQINQLFVEIKSQRIAPPPPPPTTTPPAGAPINNQPKPTVEKHPLNLDLSKVLAAIGSLIIIIAVLIVVYSQWSNVGAFGRVSFIGLPMLILFIVGASLKNKQEYQSISELTVASAGLIFPFFLGTFLYQFEIYPRIDELLFAYSALGSFIVFLFIEFAAKYSRVTPLTVLSFIVMIFSFMIHLSSGEPLFYWLFLLISVVVFIFGAILVYREKLSCQIYLNIGAIGMIIFFPAATIVSIDKMDPLQGSTMAIIISLFSIYNIALVSLFYYLNQKLKLYSFYMLKRVIEELSPLQLILPLLLVGIGEDKQVYTGIVVIISLIFMLISYIILIQSLIWIGSVGLVISLIELTSQLFDFNSTNWPIFLIIIGFFLIAVSIAVKKFLKNRKEHPPINFGQSIGIGPDPQFETKDATGKKHGNYSCWIIIIIFILLVNGVPWLIDEMSYRSYDNPEYSPTPYSTYSATPYNYIDNTSGIITEITNSGNSIYYITISHYGVTDYFSTTSTTSITKAGQVITIEELIVGSSVEINYETSTKYIKAINIVPDSSI